MNQRVRATSEAGNGAAKTCRYCLVLGYTTLSKIKIHDWYLDLHMQSQNRHVSFLTGMCCFVHLTSAIDASDVTITYPMAAHLFLRWTCHYKIC
jgi:hypothetical protein